MDNLFEIIDKSGRTIRLPKKSWSHLRKKHPEVITPEYIEETLKNPIKIADYSLDDSIRYYYKYFKHKSDKDKYLLVLVKYLNNHGYVITAYFTDNIK